MQELLDVQLTETPVTLTDYKSYKLSDLPKVILGFQIRNQFDEKRLQFKPEYKTKKILHYTNNDKGCLEPIFFYGIELTVKEKYNKFLNDLNHNIIIANIILKSKKTDVVTEYKNYLKAVGLGCEESYLHTCDGVFPIDLKYLSELVEAAEGIPIHDLPSMLKITKEQWYLNIGSFGIYVLGTSGFYNL